MVSPSHDFMLALAVAEAFAFVVCKAVRDYDRQMLSGQIDPAVYAAVINSGWHQFTSWLAIAAIWVLPVYAFVRLPWLQALAAVFLLSPVLAIVIELAQGALYAQAIARGRGIGGVTFIPWGLVVSTGVLAWLAAQPTPGREAAASPRAAAQTYPDTRPEPPPAAVMASPAPLPRPGAWPPQPASLGTIPNFTITSQAANLRACPATRCESLTVLPQGSYNARVTRSEGSWNHIEFTDGGVPGAGWVHRSVGREGPSW